MRKIGYIASGVVVGSSLMIASSAIAGGFAIREQSTTGLGVAFADSAAGSDLSSMYWNPAAVTSQDGMNSLASNTVIVPDTNIYDVTSPFGTKGTGLDTLGLLAGSYFNYQVNSQLYVGMSINAPFGLVTKADDQDWSGAHLNRKSSILTFNAAPTVGYKITPNISLAAGLQIEYIDVRLAGNSTGGGTGPDVVIKGKDIAVGFTLGALYKSDGGTSIGVGFRSSIDHDVSGTMHQDGAFAFDITANLKTPEMVTVSLKQQITDSFAVMANYEWANWSRLASLEVVRDADGAIPVTEDFDWEDSWFASVGAEMMLGDAMTVRAGIGYEVSPVPAATRSARLPDSDRIWLSFGGSYKWNEAMTLDFGYSHIFFEDTDIIAQKGVTAKVENSVDVVSFGLRHKF